MGKIKHPLYIYIQVSHLVHNCLIDFGALATAIAKKIIDVILFECIRTSNGVS